MIMLKMPARVAMTRKDAGWRLELVYIPIRLVETLFPYVRIDGLTGPRLE